MKLIINKTIFWVLIFAGFLTSCGKDIEGPNTFGPIAPQTPPVPIPYGSLNIYLGWEEYAQYCDSIPILVDDTVRGYLSSIFQIDPLCNELGTLTLDSLSPGTHQIFAGECDYVFWEMNVAVVKDECISIPISN